MFMNAQHRPVWNNFRAFVPSNMVEASNHRLNDIMNSETDAWSSSRPIGSGVPAHEPFNYGFNEAVNGELYLGPLPQDFYTEYFRAVPSYAQAQEESNVKIGENRNVDYPEQHVAALRQPGNESSYDLQRHQSLCFESAVPQLRVNAHKWMTGYMAASSNIFSYGTQPGLPSAGDPSSFSMYNTPSGSDGFASLKSEPDMAYSNSVAAGAAPTGPMTVSFTSSVHNTPLGSAGFSSTSSGPGTVYPKSLAKGAVTSNSITVQSDLGDGKWWHDIRQDHSSAMPYNSTLDFNMDGLPKVESEIWPMHYESTSDYSPQAAPQGTISPHVLSICAPSCSPKPSIGSSISSSGEFSVTSAASKAFRDIDDMSHPTVQSLSSKVTQIHDSGGNIADSNAQSVTSQDFQIQEYHGSMPDPNTRVLRPRHKLPSERTSHVDVPELPIDACVQSKTEKKRSIPSRSAIHSGRVDYLRSSLSNTRQSSRKVPNMQRPFIQKKVEKYSEGKTLGNVVVNPKYAVTPSETIKALQHREAKDDFLKEKRRAGMSYKDIRVMGGFTEAESTLRGRFRTLTKASDERVRKPVWEENDIHLLKEAVQKLGGEPYSSKKVPWKRVSDFIFDNGGSYRFGNSTCRKRWDELCTESRDQDVS